MDDLAFPGVRILRDGETEDNCDDCFFLVSDIKGQKCVLSGVPVFNPVETSCSLWVKGCEDNDEETRHILERCPWCDYTAERTVPDSAYARSRKALKHMVGMHIMSHHADKIADICALATGGLQAFTGAAVDASRRLSGLAEYARGLGRITGKMQREAREIRVV